MTLVDPIELPSASALFLIVFVGAVVGYLRGRTPVTGAVVLVFAATMPVFAARVVEYLGGIEVPPAISAVVTLALLAQPLLSLRLASLLYPVPSRLLVAALVAYLLTAVPVAVVTAAPQVLPPVPLLLAALTVYGITSFAAATYFWLAAKRRMGSARVRLKLASGATLLMAGTLILAGAAAVIAGGSSVLSLASRYGVLLAAIAYMAAFMAPGWLRRLWQARTGYELSRRLLSGPADADAPTTWQRFAQLAAGAAGVRHAMVLMGNGRGARSVASVGGLPLLALEGEQFADLLAQADAVHQLPVETAPPALRTAVAGTPVRYLTLVVLQGADDASGLLFLGGERRSLFSRDDREMFRLLGAEAVVLASRAGALAEQRQLSARLSETIEALHASARAKDDFLASMSHELRTPLNAILGFSDLMRDEPESDGRRSVPAGWIDHVHVAGQHLLGLINDVLDLAKVEAGRLDLRVEKLDGPAAVRETLAELRPLALQKQITLSAEVEEGMTLFADRGRLRQILYNLVSNAIKFTPEEGQVRVEGGQSSDGACLSVVDTGIGIAPADQERVFEEFTQVGDQRTRAAGTGLGLALVRRLVEAHGGHVELVSEPGVGSRFTIVLPVPPVGTEASRAPSWQTQASTRPLLPDAARADGKRPILIIEDDPQAVELVRSYLEPDGYRLVAATNGVDGIAIARQLRPAAILLDVILPQIDGWEVLRRLKADEQLGDIPVMMLTVIDEQEVGLALGAVDYLVKPIDRATLLGAIRRHVAGGAEGSRRRVLAADDDPAALELVRSTLEPHGYEVVLAGGGREAIFAAQAGRFDLVVSDLLMPDLDGFEVVAQLKTAEATRDTPILILTAHWLSDADKARLNGKIIGVCEKGSGAAEQLQRWLTSATAAPSATEAVG